MAAEAGGILVSSVVCAPGLQCVLMCLRLVWHIVGFFVVLIPLVYLGRKNSNSADFVFTSTLDGDLWSNYGIAFCIGLTVNTFPFVGMSCDVDYH